MTRFHGLYYALICLLGTCLAGSPRAQAPLPELTTDTPEYCARLHAKLGQLVRQASSPPPADVVHLSVQGQEMCDRGQIRAGVQRLRRAMVIMKQHTASN